MQHPVKPIVGGVLAGVVAEVGFEADAGDLGLMGVNLPRMGVKHGGLRLLADFGQGATGEGIGEDAEVAAANGNVQLGTLPDRGGEFGDRAVFGVNVVDLVLATGNSVAVMAADGENARVDGEALLGQNIQGP